MPHNHINYDSAVVSLISFIAYIFIFGPLPEDLGWRGYVLDELQERMNAVVASLVLGTLWAIWHLPLFFMNGTYQNEMGFGTAAFGQFCVFARPRTCLKSRPEKNYIAILGWH